MNVYDWWCVIITSRVNNFIKFSSLILVLVLFLANVKYISNSILSSLKFCYRSLIPSIFPFLLISQAILCSNWLDASLNSGKKHSNNILGICKIYFSSIAIGLLCGFIVGASDICEKSKRFGHKNHNLTDYIFLSTNASCGFVIGCVGAVLLNNVIIGIYLYISQIVISLILFAVFKEKGSLNESIAYSQNKVSSFKLISSSIKRATDAMLSICSYTIVFRAIISLLDFYLNKNKSIVVSSIISSIFELASGVFSSASIENFYISLFLIGFSVGFSGLCVIFQTISLCDGLYIKKWKFTLLKLFQGILCGISLIFYGFIKNLIL